MGVRKLIFRLIGSAIGLLALNAAAGDQPRKFMSLSYNPSGVITEAQMTKGFSEDKLHDDLQRLLPYTNHIRTYSLDFGLDRTPAIAKSLGMKVSLGIWLGRDEEKNAAAIEKGLRVIAANSDVIDRVYVGNEAVVRGDLTPAEVITHLKRMKSALANTVPGLQVGTAEPWYIWEKNPELAAASDFIGAHLFSFWDGVPVKDAIINITRRFDDLRKAYPTRKIVIAETGWPVGGKSNQAAVASAEAQAAFTRDFLKYAEQMGYDYNIVEAYDQLWKAPLELGSVWGVLTDNGKPKFPF
jgi:exo-beta-1,3-glucanase (GH17 family)